MFCPYCGNPCQQDHLFCFRCGKPLPEHSGTAAEADPIPAAESDPPLPHAPVTEAPAETEISDTLPETAVPQTPDQTVAPVQEPENHENQPEATAAPVGRLWPPVLILALVACFGLAVYFISIFGSTPEPQSDTPWFSISNGVLDFHAEYYYGDAELVIPQVVDGQTVTAIADHAFSGCDRISTVILPDTLIRIGEYAFSGCGELRGIYIPQSVKSVGSYAFADCDALEAVYFPGGMEQIGHSALDSCDDLRYILFNGTCAQWNELYEGRFVTEVELHATDGVFYARP